MKNDPEAIRWLESALREDPGYQAAHRLLADIHQRLGNTELARHHEQRAGS